MVVDASAVLEALLRTPVGRGIEQRLLHTGETLHAPHLLDVEIAHVVRRYAVHGEITVERGREALLDLADFPVWRYDHRTMLPRIWELRHNLTAYDATYVALAERLEARLLTRDARLAGAAGHHARVEVV